MVAVWVGGDPKLQGGTRVRGAFHALRVSTGKLNLWPLVLGVITTNEQEELGYHSSTNLYTSPTGSLSRGTPGITFC